MINQAIGASGVASQQCKSVVEQYGQTIMDLLLAEVSIQLCNCIFICLICSFLCSYSKMTLGNLVAFPGYLIGPHLNRHIQRRFVHRLEYAPLMETAELG